MVAEVVMSWMMVALDELKVAMVPLEIFSVDVEVN
jgi:hypothetical protein